METKLVGLKHFNASIADPCVSRSICEISFSSFSSFFFLAGNIFDIGKSDESCRFKKEDHFHTKRHLSSFPVLVDSMKAVWEEWVCRAAWNSKTICRHGNAAAAVAVVLSPGSLSPE